MPFHQPDSLRYYTFESLAEAGVDQAIFTRHGGVSPPPWQSLNLGGTVGDDQDRVTENRQRMFSTFGTIATSCYDVWQVHSTKVICADRPRPQGSLPVKADAILTDQPEVTLFMRFADCVPILIFDPVKRVVGLIHAGWMGTVNKIAEEVVHTLQARYRSRPEDILAALGPSIGPDHYSIGADVEALVLQAFGEDANNLLHKQAGKVQFNLWAANQLILERAGIRRIEVSGICTACHVDDWYSHRAEQGKTGRFGALIRIRG